MQDRMAKLNSKGDFVAVKNQNCTNSDNEDEIPAGEWVIYQTALKH